MRAACEPNISPAASVPTGERVALAIGKAAYKLSQIANPVNGATDMAAALRAARFQEEVDASHNCCSL